MLVQVPSPKILSEFCHEFSARVDVKAFDPERTPRELGIRLPEILRGAVIVRQAEFVAGRFAALKALTAAGCPSPGEIAVNDDRSPRWPLNFTGSITHTSGYVSAVVASRTRVSALGRDTERLLDERVALEIQGTTLVPSELKRQAASGYGVSEYVGVIFSAKESLFKALFPLVHQSFDFLDAEVIEISREHGRIRLRLLKDLGTDFVAGFELEGRFEITDRIHTAVEYYCRITI